MVGEIELGTQYILTELRSLKCQVDYILLPSDKFGIPSFREFRYLPKKIPFINFADESLDTNAETVLSILYYLDHKGDYHSC